MSTVNIDYFTETSSVASAHKLYGGWYLSAGQSFTGYPTKFSSVKFYLKRVLAATGVNAYASLYNITGTYGSTAKPAGTVIATSTLLDINSVSQTSYVLKEITFPSKPSIGFGQYAVGLVVPGSVTSATSYVLIAKNKVPTPSAISLHPGNSFIYKTTTDFVSQTAGNDVIFYAYGDDSGLGNRTVSGGGVHMARPRTVSEVLRDSTPMIKQSVERMKNVMTNMAIEKREIARQEKILNKRIIRRLK